MPALSDTLSDLFSHSKADGQPALCRLPRGLYLKVRFNHERREVCCYRDGKKYPSEAEIKAVQNACGFIGDIERNTSYVLIVEAKPMLAPVADMQRQVVLEKAASFNYPQLTFVSGNTIMRGQSNWQKAIGGFNSKQLEAVMNGLETTSPDWFKLGGQKGLE
jgi:hypothetical protein